MNKHNFRKFEMVKLIQAFACFALVLNSAGIASATPVFGEQSSAQNTHWDFDFVEQFDGLQDWRSPQGDSGETLKNAQQPKLADGSASAWNYLASDMTAEPSKLWIGAFGDQGVWRGTKSAAIDIAGAQGPSQLSLYLGDGYQDVHVFFMVNIPKNEFPTSCAGGNCENGALGRYIEGQPYTWYSSWPLLSFNTGCKRPSCAPDQNQQQTVHIKQYAYGLTPGLMLALEDSSQESELWAVDANSSLDSRLGKWFALEFHISQSATETRYTIWVYDQMGKAVMLLDNKALPKSAAAQSKTMNSITFGGDMSAGMGMGDDNADTYAWGPSMKSEYFIDDVILDDKRIGPKYFSLVQAMQASSAAKPAALIKAAAPRPPSGFKLKMVVRPAP